MTIGLGISVPEELYDYSQDIPAVTVDLLTAVSQLAANAVAAERRIAEAEVNLEKAKSAHQQIVRYELTKLMQAATQKYLETTNGLVCELKNVVHASIPDEKKKDAFVWLTDNDYASVIKYGIKLTLGKGPEAQSNLQILALVCQSLEIEYEVKEEVHAQTLCALIRECLKKGVKVPLDTLGAFVYPEVKVTKAEKK